jgi:glyoxylase-like metal-dependent hydrolase (beta-lactamase superfamily II)
MDKDFSNRRERLEKKLDSLGCHQENLKLIVLTHGDNDHVANAVYLRDKYNAKIAMHSGDLELVQNPKLEKVMSNCNYNSIIYKIVFKIMKKQIEKLTQKMLNEFESFKPDIILNEGSTLLEYGFDAKILHLPGHTAGSIGILTADGDIIIGDTFANNKKITISPNAQDFKILSESVNRLKTINIKNVYPGHGTPFEMKNFQV